MEILIDGAQTEETRLVLCKDGVIQDFKYQSKQKKSIKGDIYLAKITRVEASLQAAFVSYAPNTPEGFMPFSEIHHCYFTIPAADMAELEQELVSMTRDTSDEEAAQELDDNAGSNMDNELGADEESEGAPAAALADFYRRYKIQDVIKVGKIMLVQVKKEGKGNKGATLTTYLSLAGRYSVFMPNAINAGGVSRKIVDQSERERLKHVVNESLGSMSASSSIIIRTAGEHKTKNEIQKDISNLVSLWKSIWKHAFKSNAPAIVYEEGDIIQQAIRDMYSSDIAEIIVQGDKAYDDTVSYMRQFLSNSVHLKKIKKYSHLQPIFSRFYNIEEQLSILYEHIVQLPSGGYLVINQTEAMVSIDVNSGRATKERDIEKTARNINLEAVLQIAKQIKLRDLSGLIAIDFIDMEDSKNKKDIEQAFKAAMAHDKAKVTLSKISALGIMEISRQRLRPSFTEIHTETCRHCDGKGRVRNISQTTASIFRAIAAELSENPDAIIKVSVHTATLIHIFNTKRDVVSKYEEMSEGRILFDIDDEAGNDGFFIESIKNNKDYKQQEIYPVKQMIQDEIFDHYIDPERLDYTEADNDHTLEVKYSKTSKKKWNSAKSGDKLSSQPDSTQDEQNPAAKMRKRIRRRKGSSSTEEASNIAEGVLEGEVEKAQGQENEAQPKKNKMSLKEIWKQISD